MRIAIVAGLLPIILGGQFLLPRVMPLVERAGRKLIGLVSEAWKHATWYEKIGLVIFCFGWLIPGPLDEMLGLLLVRRILLRAKRKAVRPDWIYQEVK